MTPARFVAIATAAGIFTATKVLCFVFSAAAHQDLVSDNVGPLITIAVIVSWVGLFTEVVLNRIDQHTGRIEARIDAAVEEAGDRRAIQTAVDAIRHGERWPTEQRRRPHLVEN
jgi:hypothetical protein